MKIKNLFKNKYFNFFFPIPALCIFAIFGITFLYGEIDGEKVSSIDWFEMMTLSFILFIIPFDVLIWCIKKIMLYLKNGCFSQPEPEPKPKPKPEEIITFSPAKSNSRKKKYSVDFYFAEAGRLIIEKDKASIGILQRGFKIHFNRAARIMDQLCETGVVGEEEGTKPRKILMTSEDFQNLIDNYEFDFNTNNRTEQNDFGRVYNNINTDRLSMYNNKFDYMDGHDFEEYCSILLKSIGYSDIQMTKGSNDNGIDILATLGEVKYGIQCKRYSSDVGVKAVQEAYAGAKYYNCHVPVVLTNQFFTKQAKEMAGRINVLLWDRDYLEALVSSCKSNKFF